MIPVPAWPSIANEAPVAADAAIQGLSYGMQGIAMMVTGGGSGVARAATMSCTKKNAKDALELTLDLASVINGFMNPAGHSTEDLIKVHNNDINNEITRQNELHEQSRRFPNIHIPRRR